MSHFLASIARDHVATANAYHALIHRPESSVVRGSYAALAAETLAQWADILASGLRVEFHDGAHDYANSAEMFADMATGHLWTLRTGAETDMPVNHPMRALVLPGLMLNDVFRAVHDVNGHGRARSGFGPLGEFQAWLAHRAMFSVTALSALWCETRGQAAWTNDHGDHRAYALPDRPFATQKAGIPNPAFV